MRSRRLAAPFRRSISSIYYAAKYGVKAGRRGVSARSSRPVERPHSGDNMIDASRSIGGGTTAMMTASRYTLRVRATFVGTVSFFS
jgi:hypothetical protein